MFVIGMAVGLAVVLILLFSIVASIAKRNGASIIERCLGLCGARLAWRP